jgi:hypothetical protein
MIIILIYLHFNFFIFSLFFSLINCGIFSILEFPINTLIKSEDNFRIFRSLAIKNKYLKS